MIIAKQHELQTVLWPTRQIVLPGNPSRVVVIFACSQGFDYQLYATDGSLYEGMFFKGITGVSSVFLFRDYGPLIQGEIYANFQSAPVDFTISEILDSNFGNY